MKSRHPSPDTPPTAALASSDALRRAALARAAARGARIARRRIAWRWAWFVLSRGLLALGLGVTVLGGAWTAWRVAQGQPPSWPLQGNSHSVPARGAPLAAAPASAGGPAPADSASGTIAAPVAAPASIPPQLRSEKP